MKQLGLGFIDHEATEDGAAVSLRNARKNLQRLQSMEGISEEQQRLMNAISADGRFIDLCALFPPLPKKGNFDVKTIKQSQYFFS